MKTCSICHTEYSSFRGHCPICGARPIYGHIYYDGDIQIVAAHGCMRMEHESYRLPLLSRLILASRNGRGLCDAGYLNLI
jgi:hypothetical protein